MCAGCWGSQRHGAVPDSSPPAASSASPTAGCLPHRWVCELIRFLAWLTDVADLCCSPLDAVVASKVSETCLSRRSFQVHVTSRCVFVQTVAFRVLPAYCSIQRNSRHSMRISHTCCFEYGRLRGSEPQFTVAVVVFAAVRLPVTSL